MDEIKGAAKLSDTNAARRWHTRIHKRQFLIGLSLVALSFFMPIIFNVYNFDVLQSLAQSLEYQEKTDLALAALRLVALNSLRGIPHYVGSFFIGIPLRYDGRKKTFGCLTQRSCCLSCR